MAEEHSVYDAGLGYGKIRIYHHPFLLCGMMQVCSYRAGGEGVVYK